MDFEEEDFLMFLDSDDQALANFKNVAVEKFKFDLRSKLELDPKLDLQSEDNENKSQGMTVIDGQYDMFEPFYIVGNDDHDGWDGTVGQSDALDEHFRDLADYFNKLEQYKRLDKIINESYCTYVFKRKHNYLNTLENTEKVTDPLNDLDSENLSSAWLSVDEYNEKLKERNNLVESLVEHAKLIDERLLNFKDWDIQSVCVEYYKKYNIDTRLLNDGSKSCLARLLEVLFEHDQEQDCLQGVEEVDTFKESFATNVCKAGEDDLIECNLPPVVGLQSEKSMRDFENLEQFEMQEIDEVCDAKQYIVLFYRNKGKGGAAMAKVSFGQPMPKVSAPTKQGHVFIGFFDSLHGGKQYYDADMNSVRNWDKSKNELLFARYE